MKRTGQEVVVDTNIWIETLMKGNQNLAKQLARMETREGRRLVMISVVKMEVLYNNLPSDSFKELQFILDHYETYYPTLRDLDLAIEIMLATRRAGRGMAPIDSIIAACAVNLKAPACTADKDFQVLAVRDSTHHLRIIDPYKQPTTQ